MVRVTWHQGQAQASDDWTLVSLHMGQACPEASCMEGGWPSPMTSWPLARRRPVSAAWQRWSPRISR
jgi:hypothetical protein